ncbi:unnamed protein product [Rhizoctonia solani]|uniref:Rab-GAP TBC domain-containing protein n=1 Tax=Rhizoctonia solani TaxID=456999 RepID=A0A8H3DE33_9AGAM|nr:unnamed protein product [Rhizoctonia solani]CAE6519492.1 unnamed protein product [Rhizoctonia solani]
MSESSNRPRKSGSSTKRSSSGTANPSATLNKVLNAPRLSATKFRTKEDVDEGLKKLRRLILLDGIPTSEDPTLRPRIWKLLLRVDGPLAGDTYIQTLATDMEFKSRVREDMLIRLLDAFVWRNHDRQSPTQLPFRYVQGMNVLAAPFLYSLSSELEAFHCFSRFIEIECPLYVQPTLEGVHRGLKLLDRCLQIADPELFQHLRSKNLSAEIYAFPSVLTLCACTPPLAEVLRLWDFLLAFGVHLNILCVIAQLFLMRDSILSSTSPMKLLRTFPPLQAQPVIEIAVALVRDLPVELYDELVRHPFEIEL